MSRHPAFRRLRRHPRKILGAALQSAQAIAPDWPVGLLWPWIRYSAYRAFRRFSVRPSCHAARLVKLLPKFPKITRP